MSYGQTNNYYNQGSIDPIKISCWKPFEPHIGIVQLSINYRQCHVYMYYNESTAGADASVEMPKLRNIKLLIAFIHMMNIFALINFAACNSNSG